MKKIENMLRVLRDKPGFSQCEDHVVSLGHCAGAHKGTDG